MAYNSALDGLLGAMPGVEIVDLFDEFQTLVANPGEFGLSNSADPYVTPEQPPYACRKADEYVFWDGVHPTRVTHGIIADLVVAALAD